MTDALVEADYHKTLNWEIWKKLFFQYILPYRRLFLPLAATTLVVACCDASFTLVTRHVIDDVVARGRNADFLLPGVIYFALTVTLAVSVSAFILIAGKISTEMMYDLRRQGFFHLQKLSFSFFDKYPVGWLMARLTSDCMRLADTVAWGSLEIFWAIPFLTGIAAVMFVMDWRIALITLSVLPFLGLVGVYFKNIILKSSRQVRKTNSKLTSAYNEGITGVDTTRTMVREKANLEEFEELSLEMSRYSVLNALQTAAFFPFVLAFGSVATGLALWFGGIEVLVGALTLGTLVAFINYSGAFFEPILNLARVLADMQTAQASAERILGLLDTEPEIKDSDSVLEKMAGWKPDRNDLALDGGPDKIEEIEFENVSFAYPDGQPVLRNFDLKVASGETMALVGPTGGGKSTIVNLMCRFYEPTEGRILINGQDYRERSLHWLQSNLGIVLQTPHLFSGTVGENIRYGDLQADDRRIAAAAEIVNAHEFILDLENGYHTEVGEGGNKLSTGQKQLISFARAILADPQVFVMDEATSSVDPYTEHSIQEGLARILEGRTSFVVAHRLSTIRSADRILVIEDGTIKEQGSHRELIRQGGLYFDLYRKQFRREKEVELR